MTDTPQVLLAHHLKTLKLPTFLREYDKIARQCASEGVDHVRYLLRLAELELIDRERRMVERRIKAARFPVVKSLDSFDFKVIPSLNKALVLELARCEYIERRENLIALGNSGTGKTHIALGLGLAACQKGLSVGFITAAALVHELIEARDDKQLLRFQKKLATYKLLIVDELGFVPLSKTGAELLFEVFSQRYERGSTLVTCPSHLFNLWQKPWNFASPPDTLSGMHKIIEIFADRAALHTEILALRQQVAVLKRQRPRPSLRKADRVFWVILSCLWPGWRHALVIVRPETVIGWHRKAFRLFWTWKSRRGKPGRPPVSREIRYLVRRMSRENTRWGAPRIHGELLKLGFSISQTAVSKYMVRYPSPPSQSWRTFLTNHADCLASIDFFVVPTATFHLLFGFIVLHHERRQIVHFGVTANPTMAWVAQQIREAFPWGTAPRYLIRDRDGAYGQSFRSTVTAMGVEEVVTAPRSPWQNPYVERLIGSVRRECLDHSIILNERHLRRILGSYLDYYHGSRTHLSLGKDTPDGRPVQPAGSGTVVSLPKVGGLHHRYERLAA